MHRVHADKGYCWKRGQQHYWRVFAGWQLLPRLLRMMCASFGSFGGLQFEWFAARGRGGISPNAGSIDKCSLPIQCSFPRFSFFAHVSLPLPPERVWCTSGLMEEPRSLWRTIASLECLSSWDITNWSPQDSIFSAERHILPPDG